MNFDNLIPRIGVGALGGFLAAVWVDLDAFGKAGGRFRWDLALIRYAKGAVAGAAGALGIDAMF